MQETWEMQVWSQGWEDPLEEGMASHSSILAWRIQWTEEPGRLQSMGSQRVRHIEWLTLWLHNFARWREGAQPETSPSGGRERSGVCHHHTNFSESSLPDGPIFVSSHSEWERRWGTECASRSRHFRGGSMSAISLAWFRALIGELAGGPGRTEWLATAESENLLSYTDNRGNKIQQAPEKRNWQIPLISTVRTQVWRKHIHRKDLKENKNFLR